MAVEKRQHDRLDSEQTDRIFRAVYFHMQEGVGFGLDILLTIYKNDAVLIAITALCLEMAKKQHQKVTAFSLTGIHTYV